MQKSQTLHFLSGLPRSGSTVLAAILNQNPKVFVTPTSPLLDILNYMDQSWSKITQTHTWPDPQHKINVSRGILTHMFEHIPKPIVIDKHRGWVKNVSGLVKVFGLRPRILVTVRDIPEVLASFMTLVKKARREGKDNFVDQKLRNAGWPHSDEATSEMLWQNITETYQAIMEGLHTNPECLHLVEYKDLVNQPDKKIADIYRFLELPAFKHDFEKIENTVEEDDSFWGLPDLHKIRTQLKRTSPHPSEIIGAEAYHRFSQAQLEAWRRMPLRNP